LGGVFTRFKDPDGNSFSLVSFDEVTHASKRNAAPRREAGIRTPRRAGIEIAKQVQAKLFPNRSRHSKPSNMRLCIQARKVGAIITTSWISAASVSVSSSATSPEKHRALS